jgi:two-component system cell cycle response regulator CtrA
MRILIVEPDTATRQSIEMMLKSESFNIYSTDEGAEAIDLAKMYDYDLITLALHLPDVSGYDVIKRLRLAKVNTPILVLSSLLDPDSKIKALGVGADDYLTKPFHKDELIARIHAIVRRAKGHAASTMTIGPLVINLDARTTTIDGNPIRPTGKEYAMLELMALRRGVMITKEMFLNHLYGGRDEPELKIIDVFICKLRKKLGAHAGLIQTVWGRGYVLSETLPFVSSPSLAPEMRDLAEDPYGYGNSNYPKRGMCRASQIGTVMRSKDADNSVLAHIDSPSIVPKPGAE